MINLEDLGDNLRLYKGDCRRLIASLPDNSVDSVVTDPPYEIGFMNRSFDSTGIAFDVDLWKDILRVLKPGGHVAAFAASRTYHRLACAIEDAGFEIRDQIDWVYASGMPHGSDVTLMIDRERREDVEPTRSETAKPFKGWYSQLKPAHEPICLARKPLDGNLAHICSDMGQAHCISTHAASHSATRRTRRSRRARTSMDGSAPGRETTMYMVRTKRIAPTTRLPPVSRRTCCSTSPRPRNSTDSPASPSVEKANHAQARNPVTAGA